MPRMLRKKNGSTNGNGQGGKNRVRAFIAGPSAPDEQLDRMDAEQQRRHKTFTDMRNAVVSIGKRAGTLTTSKVDTSKPRQGPSFRSDDDDNAAIHNTVDLTTDTLDPPYDFSTLCSFFENSSALRQNIDAMATNVDGFGHRFQPVLDFTAPDINEQIRDLLLRANIDKDDKAPDDLLTLTGKQLQAATPSDEVVEETKVRWKQIATIERGRAECFFEFVNPLVPFTEVRTATRESLELMGNAGWEVIREDPADVESKVSQVYHVPFVNVRLIRADKKPTEVEMTVRRDAIHFAKVTVQRFFRRYVRETGTTRLYFKEFGDPRIVSQKTGTIYESLEAMQDEQNEGKDAKLASEFFHWKVRSPISAYGIPRWIGTLLAVLGSRAAEEVNFLYFDNKAIPAMVLLVSGGRVSEEAVTRLESYIEDRIKGRENFHKIMVIEGLPADADVSEGDIEASGKLRLELKPLLNDLPQDALFQNYDANNIKKIGRSFRIPQLLTGDTKDMNRSCYTDDTETLTENGWKLIDAIAPDEKVAAYDPEQHRIEFVVPAERHVHEVEDELLYHFETAHTDVMVTAEHKMLMRPYYERSEAESAWRGVEAKALTNTRFRFRVAPDVGTWRARGLAPLFKIPKIDSCVVQRKDGHKHEPIKIDDFLEFLGYWISGGSLLQTQDPMSPYWVTLSQKKPAIREKIQALLVRMAVRHSIQEGRDGTTRWKISNKCLRDWLLKNCGGKSGDKRIPAEIMQSSEHHLRIIYQALMDGDGTVDSRENCTARIYYTKSTMLADQVQEIALLLGYRTRITPGVGVWRVEHSEHNETCLRRDTHLKLVPYTGRVYCFSVPSHGYFVTRRNGKVAIQGNTAEVAQAVAEEQVFQPARDAFDKVMDRHFLTSLLVHFWRFETRAPVQRIPNDLVDNAKKALDAGGMVPNEARKLLSDAFSMPLDHIDEDWAKLPPKLAITAARAGEMAQSEDDGGSRAADQVQNADGDLVARGKTTAEGGTPHTHTYIALRQGDQVRIVVLPGGVDGHTHDAETQTVSEGASVEVTVSAVTTEGEDKTHTHGVNFQVPLSKRTRRLNGFAALIHSLRDEVEAKVEQSKDEFFSADISTAAE